MRLYAAGDSLPARLLRNGALRLGNLPPLRHLLETRMRDPDSPIGTGVRPRPQQGGLNQIRNQALGAQPPETSP